MIKALQIPDVVFQHVNETFQALLPEEGCGFLLGKNGAVTEFQPVENVLHSPVAYRMSPADQIHAVLDAEDRQLDVLAIIHSHPSGPSQLSATDLREARWYDIAYVIVSFKHVHPEWRAWFFPADAPDQYEEIQLN